MTRLVIVGCGGFGREVLGLVDDLVAQGSAFEVLGFVDDHPSQENRRLVEASGYPVLGATDWFSGAARDIQYVIGIGNGAACANIDRRLSGQGFTAARLIHPDATVGRDVRLAEGVIICAGARVTTNITLGRHVHIDRNCLVGHDAILEDYSIVFPGAAIAGETRIGREALLGTLCAILPGVCLGDNCTVGAGAVVTADVREGDTVAGVPARSLVRNSH